MNTEMTDFLIPHISPERNYWLIRTEGGKYYRSFHTNNYIGISWNEIDSSLFNNKENKNTLLTKDKVLDIYNEKYKNNDEKLKYYSRNATRITNLINRFTYEIKKGDIVLIPSTNSENISFGEVLEDNIYFEENIPSNLPEDQSDQKYCPFIKRKKVRWLKTVKRDDLDSSLYSFLYSQHTVSKADKEKYAHFIDRTIDSIFIKGEMAHLTLNVQQTHDIDAFTFANLITNSIDIVNNFQDIPDGISKNIEGKKIKLKANVQSPGPIELFGPIKEILILTNLIVSIYDLSPKAFKIIGFWKKKQKDDVEETLRILQDQSFKKYKEKLLNSNEQIDRLRGNLEELDVENPTENVNSSENLSEHQGIIIYEN